MATTILTANKDAKSKKGNVIGRFLQSIILGLMARLADVINDSASVHPVKMEQRSCIRALDEMINICQSHARIARPQVKDYFSIHFTFQILTALDICLSSLCHGPGLSKGFYDVMLGFYAHEF